MSLPPWLFSDQFQASLAPDAICFSYAISTLRSRWQHALHLALTAFDVPNVVCCNGVLSALSRGLVEVKEGSAEHLCYMKFLLKILLEFRQFGSLVLLMAEILHHLRCIRPPKQWDKLLINWCRISAINSMSKHNPKTYLKKNPPITIPCFFIPPSTPPGNDLPYPRHLWVDGFSRRFRRHRQVHNGKQHFRCFAFGSHEVSKGAGHGNTGQSLKVGSTNCHMSICL